MAETVYQQMALIGSNTAGFRNADDEPWLLFRTPMHENHLNFAQGGGYSPEPDWARIDG